MGRVHNSLFLFGAHITQFPTRNGPPTRGCKGEKGLYFEPSAVFACLEMDGQGLLGSVYFKTWESSGFLTSDVLGSLSSDDVRLLWKNKWRKQDFWHNLGRCQWWTGQPAYWPNKSRKSGLPYYPRLLYVKNNISNIPVEWPTLRMVLAMRKRASSGSG